MALKIIKTSDLEEILTCNDESFLTITQKISEDNFISNKMQIKNLPLNNYYKKADIDELLKTYSKTTHNHDFNSLSNLPTTLSGYGITNVYTKTEIQDNTLNKIKATSGKVLVDTGFSLGVKDGDNLISYNYGTSGAPTVKFGLSYDSDMYSYIDSYLGKLDLIASEQIYIRTPYLNLKVPSFSLSGSNGSFSVDVSDNKENNKFYASIPAEFTDIVKAPRLNIYSGNNTVLEGALWNSTYNINGEIKDGLHLSHENGKYLALTYKNASTGIYDPYMIFDAEGVLKNDSDGDNWGPIRFEQNVFFKHGLKVGGGEDIILAGKGVNTRITALENAISQGTGMVEWNNILNKPNTFTPSSHKHAISDITNLQTTLDSKAPEKYILQFEGAISSDFRKKIIGTTDVCGFVKSFRKNDSTDACMPPYGAGLAWGQVGTHAMLYADINDSVAYISAGNNNKLNWYKQIAWKEDITKLQTTLDGKAASNHTHSIANITNLQSSLDSKVPIIKETAASWINELNVDIGFYTVPHENLINNHGEFYNVVTLGSFNSSTYQDDTYRSQIAMPFQDGFSNELFIRKTTKSNGVMKWTDWERMAKASELSNYLPLSGGNITGELILENGKRILGKNTDDTYINLVCIDKFNHVNVSNSIADQLVLNAKSGNIVACDGSKIYTVYHSGNFNPSNYFSRSGQNTTNLNTCYDVGIYFYTDSTTGAPNRQYGHILNTVSDGNKYNGSNNWLSQLAFNTDDTIWHRSKVNSGGWTNWTKLVKTTDLNNYLPKSGGNVSGNIILNNTIKISSKDKGGTVRDLIWMNNTTAGEVVVGGGSNQVTFDIPTPKSLKIWCDGTQQSYDVYHSGNDPWRIKTLGKADMDTTLNSRGQGFLMKEAYNGTSSGYPKAYGNVLRMGGTGSNELLFEWCDGTAGMIYHRCLRDVGTSWTPWRRLAYADELSNYLPKSGGTITGELAIEQDKGIVSSNVEGGTLLVETSTNVNVGKPTKAANLICSVGYVNGDIILTADNYMSYMKNIFYVLFERNNGTINKNINTCFESSSGKFTAPLEGQYLVMCSGYKLSTSDSMYIACVVGYERSNRNELYRTGSSGFTLITLSEKETLQVYKCPAGNVTTECISANSYVNMLIARIK